MGGAWLDALRRMVLGIAAVSVLSEIAMQICGDEDNGIGMICGLCVAGCMLDAVKTVFDSLM